MATTARNIGYRKYLDAISFNVGTGTDFNEGDLMVYDTGTNMVRPIASGGDAPYLLGDAQGTSPVAHHTATANDRLRSVSINIGPHTVKLIAREVATFTKFTPVFYHTDAQSFHISGTGTPIGCMLVDAKECGTDTGTTVIGQEYEVLLREAYLPSGLCLGQ